MSEIAITVVDGIQLLLRWWTGLKFKQVIKWTTDHLRWVQRERWRLVPGWRDQGFCGHLAALLSSSTTLQTKRKASVPPASRLHGGEGGGTWAWLWQGTKQWVCSACVRGSCSWLTLLELPLGGTSAYKADWHLRFLTEQSCLVVNKHVISGKKNAENECISE